MRTLVAAACACVLQAVALSQGPPPGAATQTGTAVIAGDVLDAVTGRPISGTVVTLQCVGANAPSIRVRTDAQGRYVLREVPRGSYSPCATRAGYTFVAGGYYPTPPRSPDDRAETLPVDDGVRLTNIHLYLWKQGAITGEVVDDHGEPVVGQTVHLMRRPDGSGRWVQGGQGTTDDRGQYRILTTGSGVYVVFVESTQQSTTALALSGLAELRQAGGPTSSDAQREFNNANLPAEAAAGGSTTLQMGDALQIFSSKSVPLAPTADGHARVYTTTFNPAPPSSSGARFLTVSPGQDRIGVDFRLTPVRALRIAGQLVGPDGPAAFTALRLDAAGTEALPWNVMAASSLSDARGNFVFAAVPEGQYSLRVLKMPRVPSTLNATPTMIETGGESRPMAITSGAPQAPAPLPDTPTLWATVPVAVADRDVDRLLVTLARGARLSGRIEFDGTAARPTTLQIQQMTISPRRADGIVLTQLPIGRGNAAGGFSTFGMPSGPYFLSAVLPQPWILRSAMWRDRDVADLPLDVGAEDIGDIVLTFTDKRSELSGTLRDAQGTPVSGGTVMAFPADRRYWSVVDLSSVYGTIVQPRRMKLGRPSTAGVFRIPDLPAGDYFVAGSRTPVDNWTDPGSLDRLSRTAVRVSIAEGEKKSQDVRVGGSSIDDSNASGPFVPEDEPATFSNTPTALAQQATTSSNAGSIAGTVVLDDRSAAPLRNAVVTLNGSGVARTAITDDAGRFAFAGLPAGRFLVGASKAAYVRAEYGASRPGRTGTPVGLTEGARATITIKMLRGAVIAGSIVDDGARTLPFTFVQLFRSQFINGERALVRIAQDDTDDRGMYRFYGLAPGEYFVTASPGLGTGGSAAETTAAEVQWATRSTSATLGSTAPPDRGRLVTYAPVYYPGALERTRAQGVTVAAGEERSDVNFALALMPAVKVAGTVTGASGQPIAAQITIAPRDATIPTWGSGINAAINGYGSTRSTAEGRFEIGAVTPGEYTLTARVPPAQWAIASVAIGDDTPVNLILQPGLAVSGEIIFNGTQPPPDLTRLRVTLTGTQSASAVALGVTPATIGADRQFSFTGVTPGRYRVDVTGGLGSWSLVSATAGGNDVLDAPLTIAADASVKDLRIALSDRASELSGLFQDASGRPGTEYFVIVFPSEPKLWTWQSRRIRAVRPGTNGRYVASNLPAGEYLVAAVADVEQNEWFDPEFLKTLVPASVRVTLADGEKKTTDLRVR